MQAAGLPTSGQVPERTDFNNYGTVQNQASSQVVNGSQYFGDVRIYNGTVATSQSTTSSAGTMEDVLGSLAFPGMLDRRASIRSPHRDTCNWIFELAEYRTWRHSKFGLLWIKGKPGSGKSTIMSVLYTKLRTDDNAVNEIHLEFFFSARGSELQHTPLGMFRSLLNQLLCQDVSISLPVWTSYQAKCRAYGNSQKIWAWQQFELEQLFLQAVLVSSKKKTVTIFIDALDEAGAEGVKHVAQYFHELNDQAAAVAANSNQNDLVNLKICMSSRHYPVVSSARSSEIVVEQHNSSDIQVYVQDKLDLGFLDPGQSLDPSEWHEVTSDILRRARGMFQWVCLVLPLLTKKLEDGWPLQDMRNLISSLPQDLGDVYSAVLLTHLDRQHLSTSLLLFKWVCYSGQPLSPREMMDALAAGDRHVSGSYCSNINSAFVKRRIRSLSAGLVEAAYDKSTNLEVVEVVHQTVYEFLVNGGLILISDLCRSQSSNTPIENYLDRSNQDRKCYLTLYECCLNYLECLDLKIREEFVEFRKRWEQGMVGLDDWAALREQAEPLPLATLATGKMFEYARKGSNVLFEGKYQTADLQAESERFRRVWPIWSVCFRMVRHRTLASNLAEWSVWHTAAYENMGNLVQSLAEDNDGIDQEDEEGRTPLYVASNMSNREVVRALLHAGANMNISEARGITPLMASVSQGDLMSATLLLRHGARVNAVTFRGHSALMYAVFKGDLAFVQLLHDAGADPHHEGRGESRMDESIPWTKTRLSCLARLMERLEQRAISAIEQDELISVLHPPLPAQRAEAIEALIGAGVDFDLRSTQSSTVLCDAIRTGRTDIVKGLIDSGADVNVEASGGGPALLEAMGMGQIEITKMLLKAGADPNVEWRPYGSALHIAVSSGPAEIVKALLDAGAKVNAQDGHLATALNAALERGRPDIIKMLIAAGAHVDPRNHLHKAILHLSVPLTTDETPGEQS